MPNLVNLDRSTHQDLRVDEERAFAACKAVPMCAVVLSEIPRLVIEYPLVFTRNGETGQYICVALFGVDPGHNLFWRDGRWNSFTVPLNVGRQPFFVGITESPAGGERPKGLVTCIDLDNPGVQTSAGEALFDAAGAESPYLRHKMMLLNELIDGEPTTLAFIEKLVTLELIQPIQLELQTIGAPVRKISGLYSIDERKVRALDAKTFTDLHAAGYLHAIYAMMSSLGHLQILARRSALLPV
jgi:hypothetical protein